MALSSGLLEIASEFLPSWSAGACLVCNDCVLSFLFSSCDGSVCSGHGLKGAFVVVTGNCQWISPAVKSERGPKTSKHLPGCVRTWSCCFLLNKRHCGNFPTYRICFPTYRLHCRDVGEIQQKAQDSRARSLATASTDPLKHNSSRN